MVSMVVSVAPKSSVTVRVTVLLRPALFLPLCIDLFEVGQAQKTHDYEGGNLA